MKKGIGIMKNNKEKLMVKGKKPEQELKPKPLHKTLEAGNLKASIANVKWVLEGKKLYKAVGNKVTLEKIEPSDLDYLSIAMLIEDGVAVVSGEHFWTVKFGGVNTEYPTYPFAGVTNSRWLKEECGLFYSGILSKSTGSPRVEFGPVINSGDVVGILCSFSKVHLNVYFYHNRRSLGLSFQVPASLFLPDGIRPCVKLGEVGAWATITKEPKEKIPKQIDRVRAPVAQFGVEGIWRFKGLLDSKSGKIIAVKINEKNLKMSGLTIKEKYGDPSKWFILLGLTHYVSFYARKMEQNLWIKSESIHEGGTRERPLIVHDHSLYADFPILEIINNPEKVDFQDQEMRVTKGERTVIFNRFIKIRKGNVFTNEYIS